MALTCLGHVYAWGLASTMQQGARRWLAFECGVVANGVHAGTPSHTFHERPTLVAQLAGRLAGHALAGSCTPLIWVRFTDSATIALAAGQWHSMVLTQSAAASSRCWTVSRTTWPALSRAVGAPEAVLELAAVDNSQELLRLEGLTGSCQLALYLDISTGYVHCYSPKVSI